MLKLQPFPLRAPREASFVHSLQGIAYAQAPAEPSRVDVIATEELAADALEVATATEASQASSVKPSTPVKEMLEAASPASPASPASSVSSKVGEDEEWTEEDVKLRLKKQTVKVLRAFARQEGWDIEEARLKSEVVAALTKHVFRWIRKNGGTWPEKNLPK